jgi:hypothetical protein
MNIILKLSICGGNVMFINLIFVISLFQRDGDSWRVLTYFKNIVIEK